MRPTGYWAVLLARETSSPSVARALGLPRADPSRGHRLFTAPARRDARPWWTPEAVLAEVMILASVYVVYMPLGSFTPVDGGSAVAHGRLLWALEARIGVAVEWSWWEALSRHPWWEQAAHLYYADSIYLAPALVAVTLAVRAPGRYRGFRRVFVAVTVTAYLIFWLYPVAPPCLLPGSGMDSGALPPPDPYAALPSLHVAWAAVVLLGLRELTVRRSVRMLGVAHVVVTVVVVLATGHHFVVDVVAALALVWGVHRYEGGECPAPVVGGPA
jgi:PAP2 superfamily